MSIVNKICALALFVGLLSLSVLDPAWAAGPPKVLERQKVIMVGDHLVDVAAALGVVPEAMAIRMSLWPKGKELALFSQALGCPNKVTNVTPDSLPKAMKARGITRIIVEKCANFCLYKNIDLNKVAELVRSVPGASVEYVDFDKGLPAAIEAVAAKIGKVEEGKALAAAHAENLKQAEAALPKQALGKRVLVLSGTYAIATGKVFINVEAPGGYSDQYILSRLGCVNVGKALIPDPSAISKGHASSPRLGGIKEANPDAIVMVGEPFAVQKALRDALKRDPSLAQIPAIKNGAVYSLPFYANAGLLEYPDILRQWTDALKN